MKIIRRSLCLVIAMLVQWLNAQTSAMLPLKVGEQSPDYVFEQILNYKAPTAKISDFRGKLLLLDIWSPWCASCIASFPKMEGLQQKFSDRIQVLLVGDDGYEAGRISKYVEKKKGSNMEVKLPVPVIKKNDVFRELFDWTGGLPHIVWIDDTGKVIAITDGIAASEENIMQVLNGGGFSFQTKEPTLFINETDNFLLNRTPSFPSKPVFGSAFSTYNSDLGGYGALPMHYFNDSTHARVVIGNRPLIETYFNLYQSAKILPEINGSRKLIIIEGEVLQKYKNPMTEVNHLTSREIADFNRDNRFSYELSLPPMQYSDAEVYQYIIDDFDRFFHIRSGVETKRVRCLALIRTSKVDKIKTSLKKEEPALWDADYEKISMKGYTMKNLLRLLNGKGSIPMIILDETGYNEKIDITIPVDGDINSFQEILKKYDLTLKEVERDLNFLVLRPAI